MNKILVLLILAVACLGIIFIYIMNQQCFGCARTAVQKCGDEWSVKLHLNASEAACCNAILENINAAGSVENAGKCGQNCGDYVQCIRDATAP